MTYTAPVDDILFALEAIGGFHDVAQYCPEPGSPELLRQVIETAGAFATDVLSPLNQVGDRAGAVLDNGVVRTAPGFRDAYRRYADGGWMSLPFDPAHGGQGLPWMACFAVQEMMQAANMAWSLCPMLTTGAIEVLLRHGSAAQRSLYLPKLMSGEWTATMEMTEPQAGSDVGALRTRATRDGERYRITGQKIFITYGDHDWTDNILHVVLARLPDAPSGSRGVTLFLAPKFLPDDAGELTRRNDLRVVSLEHKLGIHGSPTCVMAYGDSGGALGELIGAENDGMACMFTLMNNARLQVGLQGLGVAEHAYQQAAAYARTRIQGRAVGAADDRAGPIIRHPDVRRMLLSMKAQIEAMRGLIYSAGASLDLAQRHPDTAMRARHQARLDLLTPVVKAWCTDTGIEISSTAIQVHGGAGYIEETGAAQHYRDARIAAIYEGANGVQANDLTFRKLARDRGAAARDFLAETAALDAGLAVLAGEHAAAFRRLLAAGRRALDDATAAQLDALHSGPRRAAAGAAPYLRLFGIVAGGAALARGLIVQARLAPADAGASEPRVLTARFYADHVLAQAPGLLHAVRDGAAATLALPEESF